MIGSLQTWQWASSDDARPLHDAVAAASSIRRQAKLRESWSPEQIGVVSELLTARAKASRKFPDHAATLIADREGLEMASSARAATHKAARFKEHLGEDAPMIDACCGIGGDTMAFASDGLDVTAIDVDERRAWMAGSNAHCDHRTADIRSLPKTKAAIHIDPARRSGSNRTHDADAFEPPVADIAGLIHGAPIAAIKLNPGVQPGILPPGELEIISERGTLTQAILWAGPFEPGRRRATLLAANGSTHSLSGSPDRTAESNDADEFIHTTDPSLERADLVPALLEAHPFRPVHPGTGLLTSDTPLTTPWTTAFRVHTECAWTSRNVKHALRDMNAGIVTVKTRAGVVDPDRLSRQLRGDGDTEAVVFILPFGARIRALVTERIHQTPNALPR